MGKVFKITKVRQNKKTKSRKWYGRYTDANGIQRRVSLFQDKLASEQELARLTKQAERARSGMLDPSMADSVETPLIRHLEGYAKALQQNGKPDSDWHQQQFKKIMKVLTKARTVMFADVSRARILEAITDLAESNGWAKRTKNHHIKATKAFFKWMLSEEKVSYNPIQTLKVEKVKDADVVHPRRAFSIQECQYLLEYLVWKHKDSRPVINSPRQRACLYLAAFRTGFRAKELMSLTPSSVNLERREITVLGEFSKSGTTETNPFPEELSEPLAFMMDGKGPREKLWAGCYHKGDLGKRLKRDMIHARQQYIEEAKDHCEREKRNSDDFLSWKSHAGLFADFHASRTSYSTHLIQSGVSIKAVQKLCRHADPATTLKFYSKITGPELISAVNNLPSVTNGGQEGHQKGHHGHQKGHQTGDNLRCLVNMNGLSGGRQAALQVVDNSEDKAKKSVHLTGFEPVTFGSVDRCSIQLSYRCILR